MRANKSNSIKTVDHQLVAKNGDSQNENKRMSNEHTNDTYSLKNGQKELTKYTKHRENKDKTVNSECTTTRCS